MGRVNGRSALDTRRQVLDAAATTIRKLGPAASLDLIARTAGVSKGGLKYHFTSKDELFRALANDLLEGFREEVANNVDPHDQEAGRFVRAYVRTRMNPAALAGEARDFSALVSLLSTEPAVLELARADATWWDERLAADGLPERVYSVVVAAADGISCSAAWGSEHSPAEIERITGYLLDLTRS
ncbi:TetR/AcrR family transcriptional regulator [Nocardia panacis]|uniref:TetR/AcrR family transcriptional regulator n=1 Tax=Nocardia panacis TaxID=2340916 RepID=A0A3A4KIV2_9NOCA|nr:TetR family transcriptional regulator [Nocardia panacis]RJO69083.1 TetR/AcrR family transcriptional regulator [Nocardia panacis]